MAPARRPEIADARNLAQFPPSLPPSRRPERSSRVADPSAPEPQGGRAASPVGRRHLALRIATTLAAVLAVGSCDQHVTPPANAPAEDPEAALSGEEGPSGAPSQTSGQGEFQDRSIGDAPDLEGFESALAMLEPGQCLLEYGRANGRWLRFVRTLNGPESGPTSPFAVDYRLRGGRVVYRATCDVALADRESALEAISWAPGNGEHAAGKGWPRNSPDGAAASTRGPSRSPLATHIDPFEGNDYDWCYVLWEGDHIVEKYDCGYDDDPEGCVDGEELDGYMGECVEREDIDGGSDPDDPGDPEECDPSEAICEEPELVVECDPLTPVRGTPTSCTASVTEGGSMSDLSWSFTYEGGTLSELGSDNPLAGPMAVSGTLRAIAFINDGPPDTASVFIDVQPRSEWATMLGSYVVQPQDIGSEGLPLHPTGHNSLGDFGVSLAPDGDASEATTLIEGGPNDGVRYFTVLPGLSITGEIRINRPALELGSDFMNLQTDAVCRSSMLTTKVEEHEGLAPVQEQSHTKYYQDKFNEEFPGLLESVAGAGDWVTQYIAARNAAMAAADTHSGTLDQSDPYVSFCDLEYF